MLYVADSEGKVQFFAELLQNFKQRQQYVFSPNHIVQYGFLIFSRQFG